MNKLVDVGGQSRGLADYACFGTASDITVTVMAVRKDGCYDGSKTITVGVSKAWLKDLMSGWSDEYDGAIVESVVGGTVYAAPVANTSKVVASQRVVLKPGMVLGRVAASARTETSSVERKLSEGAGSCDATTGAAAAITAPSGATRLEIEILTGTGAVYMNIDGTASSTTRVGPKFTTGGFDDSIPFAAGSVAKFATDTGTSTFRYVVWGVQ